MDIEEYASGGIAAYKKFTKVVALILQEALKKENSPPQFWEVQYRAKSPDSLKSKLEKRGLGDCRYIEKEIKDLAGCRIVCYSNDDVSRLLNSGVISENFDVDWDQSKIHHSINDDADVSELYRAYHYLVTLKDARAALPEYADFKDLRCEIQIQTILDHAWSETSHDIIYKPENSAEDFGKPEHDRIKKRMAKIMKKHLIPAGHEFQKVLHDFDRLRKGQELFDRSVLEEIRSAKDNNERYDILERYGEYVLPNYNDIPKVFEEIRTTLVEAIVLARKIKTVPIKVPGGEFPGKSSDDITRVAMGCFEFIRFIDPETTFATLCELYKSSKSENEAQHISNTVGVLAEHNLFTWEKVGPALQSSLIAQLCDRSESELEALFPIVVDVCSRTLSTEVTGTSSTSNTVTFHRGSVVVSKSLKDARAEAISILQRLFSISKEEDRQRKIIAGFETAAHIGPVSGAQDKLLVTVLEDTRKILEFYRSEAINMSLEIKQSIEHDALWVYRRNKDLIESEKFGSEVKSAASRLVEEIISLRDYLNCDELFVRHKTLVGYESVFPISWEIEDLDHKKEDEYRDQAIAQYSDQIITETFEEWYEVILRCAKTKSSDGATFPKFIRFLRQIAKDKPEFFIPKLRELDSDLAAFLSAILGGLSQSAKSSETFVIVDDWIDNSNHLEKVARFLGNEEFFDRVRLEKLYSAAVNTGDTYTIFEILEACLKQEDDDSIAETKTLFLNCIDYFTDRKDARWVNHAWIYFKRTALLAQLSNADAKRLLDNLVYSPRLDYHEEELLKILAEKDLELAIQFFDRRLNFEHEDDDKVEFGAGNRYEAIPYKFDQLNSVFAEDPGLVLKYAMRWYAASKRMFQFRGGRFVSNVFDKITDEFQSELISLIHSQAAGTLDMVMKVLRNYEGEIMLHPICRELIIAIPTEDSSRRTEVMIILESTGVVRGPHGRMESHVRKQDEIRPWLEDKVEKIRDFAAEYIRALERQIADEHRRVEQNIALRKRNFGEDDEESDPA